MKSKFQKNNTNAQLNEISAPLNYSIENNINAQTNETSVSLAQDVVNQIAKNLPYNKELARLRQSSTRYNVQIENTDAGKLARKASELNPSWIRTLIASLTGNKYEGAGIIELISTAISVAISLDYSKSFDVATVGKVVAAGVAGYIGGAFLSIIARHNNPGKKDIGYFDLIGTTFFCACFSIFCSVAAGLLASIFSCISRGYTDFPNAVETTVCSKRLYEQLCEYGLECTPFWIAFDTIVTSVANSALTVTKVFCATTVITRLGIFSNNRQIETSREEMKRLREPLNQPYTIENSVPKLA